MSELVSFVVVTALPWLMEPDPSSLSTSQPATSRLVRMSLMFSGAMSLSVSRHYRREHVNYADSRSWWPISGYVGKCSGRNIHVRYEYNRHHPTNVDGETDGSQHLMQLEPGTPGAITSDVHRGFSQWNSKQGAELQWPRPLEPLEAGLHAATYSSTGSWRGARSVRQVSCAAAQLGIVPFEPSLVCFAAASHRRAKARRFSSFVKLCVRASVCIHLSLAVPFPTLDHLIYLAVRAVG